MNHKSYTEQHQYSNREETKHTDDDTNNQYEHEQKWMYALRATVLFLALSPNTPQQNHTLRQLSTDSNLDKIVPCRDIINILLHKLTTHTSHTPNLQSKIESWDSYTTTTASTSTLTMMDQSASIIQTNSSEDDVHYQYLCIRRGVFSGGIIERIGRRFTTSVLGMHEPTPALTLPIVNTYDHTTQEYTQDTVERSFNVLGLPETTTTDTTARRLSYDLPISVPHQIETPCEEERDEENQQEEVEIGKNGKGRITKPQFLMNGCTSKLANEQRFRRHHSVPSIISSFETTPILQVLAPQTSYESPLSSYDSPSCSIIRNDTNISSSQHNNHLQTESTPIVENINKNIDNFIDLEYQQKPNKYSLPRKDEPATPVVPYSDGKSPIPYHIPKFTSTYNRSPQQSLWLENATQYEVKGNYTKARYYYDLYLAQLRESSNTFHPQQNKPVSSDCVEEKTETSEHEIQIPISYAIEMAWLLHKVGVVRWKTGEYDTSLSPLLEATSSLRHLYVNSSCDGENRKSYGVGLGEILNSIGMIYFSRGECEQARMFFEESYDILKNVCTQSPPDVVHIATNKCKEGLRQQKNEYDKESGKLKPLQGSQQEAEVEITGIIMHPSMAQTIIAIGMIDDVQGKYSIALQKFKRGYYIQRRILCDDHVDIAATFNVIGITRGKMAHHKKAIKYHKKALKIYTQRLGKNHVDVAVTQNNIGQIYYLLGNFTKSMVAFTESLRVMKVALGESHRNVAASLHNISLIHLACGEVDEALLILKDVFKSQRKALGDDHMDVALTLESIGDAYERKGRLDRGIKLYKKALRIRRNAYGKSHLYVAFTLDRIGKSLMSHGKDLKEAMRRFHEALNLYQLNGLLNEDERVILARTNLQKIRDKLELLDATRDTVICPTHS